MIELLTRTLSIASQCFSKFLDSPASKPKLFCVLYFQMDWCGSAYRSHHLRESQSITVLNKDLQWHGKTSYLPDESPLAGKDSNFAWFDSEENALDYLMSSTFANQFKKAAFLSKNGRRLRDLKIAKISMLNQIEYSEYSEYVPDFVARVADKTCREYLELNVAQ